MKDHMEKVILHRSRMPEEMSLDLFYCKLHFNILSSGIDTKMSFRFGMSFSATITENASQFKISKKGGTKLSDIITGTHS
ncbi:LOW QUALITY PROTEIN: uncharacterized protein LOC110690968 [Chenopodium quinoa]|uniref:LOW QUALITY PROTEIN: uncharacterized protein LOC110690968 n=1 Tax=Chenopodium quinoa TaxID=63459 RepID=UPI000B78973D|nr:LOW QUALITY PROTEIN: uncharacterized protein LOC110690968 [Chenopodium quinoa]